MPALTRDPKNGGQFKRRGDPTLDLKGPIGGAPPKGGPAPTQIDPGTVAIVQRQTGSSPGTTVEILVGRVDTADLRATDPAADPRWREIWSIDNWELFASGATELVLTHKLASQMRALAGATSTGPRVGLVEYNYMVFNDDAATRLGATFPNFTPVERQYVVLRDDSGVVGWLYRSRDSESWCYDVWVLKGTYTSPRAGHDIRLVPHGCPYADTAAFLADKNSQRAGATNWLAVCGLYPFTPR